MGPGMALKGIVTLNPPILLSGHRASGSVLNEGGEAVQDREAEKRRVDSGGAVNFSLGLAKDSYRHADGWELNKNRISADKYLLKWGGTGPGHNPHRRR